MRRRVLYFQFLSLFIPLICHGTPTALISRNSADPATSSPLHFSGTSPGIFAGDDETVIFFADFEASTWMNNWLPLDLTNPGPTWHRDTYNAFSGQSWWSGKTSLMGYDNHWLQYLETPPINLSGALNPVLTCSLYWAVEAPSVYQAYDGWDGCNVWVSITGGNTWDVLQPDYPAYNSQSLYSFGWLWGMGPGIPGWTGSSGGWRSARFNLNNYAAPNVRFRFAFCSDAATCTAENPSLLGFFLDNIEVRSGSTVYLSNFADGNGYPSEFTTATGPPSGNYWVLTTNQNHSPSHSWNCDDRFFLSDALVSPPIALPQDSSTVMTYWVYCNMPDYNGDNDDYLDDYYYIEIAPAGSDIWIPLVYDWAHNGSQLQWVERTTGFRDNLPTNNIDLTPWEGQSVKIRFRVVTDGDNDGGQGSGLYVDDIILLSGPIPNHDVGAAKLIVPFPTYQGQGTISCSVDLVNYGLFNQAQVPASYSVNGSSTALIPWLPVAAGDTLTKLFSWSTPSAGAYVMKAYTHLVTDENRSNDTTQAGTIEVTPPGVFELGYDHRQLTYLPDFYSPNFPQGQGPMVHFTPAADGIPGILYGDVIKAMFSSTGAFTIHIFADNAGGGLGTEVWSAPVTITEDQIYPDWAEIDISNVSYLQGFHPNFWVWFEISSLNYTPNITAHLQDTFSRDHFFIYDGSRVQETLVNFNIRAVLTGSAGVEAGENTAPFSYSLQPNYPNPFNSSTTIIYSVPQPGVVTLTLYDISGRRVADLIRQHLLPGVYRHRWDAGFLPSGNYWLKLEMKDQVQARRITLIK
jgi:hypothetical protein